MSESSFTPVKSSTNKPFNLEYEVDEYILNQEEKKYPCWRASSLGQCPRKHFFKRVGVIETAPMSIHRLRTFACGNTFHDFIYNVLAKRGVPHRSEVELFDKKLDLGGRCDTIIDEKLLIDIKSQHSGSFHHIQNTAGGPFVKYPHHRKQVIAYMILLELAGTPVDKAGVVYISKDDLCMKFVEVVLTDELRQQVIEEVSLLNDCLRDGILPPCTCEGFFKDNCIYGDVATRKTITLKTPTGRIKMSKGKPVKKTINTRCCGEELWQNTK